jgi:hypothetical protein
LSILSAVKQDRQASLAEMGVHRAPRLKKFRRNIRGISNATARAIDQSLSGS